MEWYNWSGWTWVAILLAYATGGYAGWSVRATNARRDETRRSLSREELNRRRAEALVRQLARQPEEGQSNWEDLEVFQIFIRDARAIYGPDATDKLFSWGEA